MSDQQARNAAANAMRIAESVPPGMLVPGAFPTPLFSAVAEAATIMAGREDAPGFSWEDQRNDWETACANIGLAIGAPGLHCSNAAIVRLVETQMGGGS